MQSFYLLTLKIKKNIIPVIKGSVVVHRVPCLHRQDGQFVTVRRKYSYVSLQPIVNFKGGDVPQKVKHCTAFNDRYSFTA